MAVQCVTEIGEENPGITFGHCNQDQMFSAEFGMDLAG
jgi:hypothetical protein